QGHGNRPQRYLRREFGTRDPWRASQPCRCDRERDRRSELATTRVGSDRVRVEAGFPAFVADLPAKMCLPCRERTGEDGRPSLKTRTHVRRTHGRQAKSSRSRLRTGSSQSFCHHGFSDAFVGGSWSSSTFLPLPFASSRRLRSR